MMSKDELDLIEHIATGIGFLIYVWLIMRLL